jgi:voltage-gated potassium channel
MNTNNIDDCSTEDHEGRPKSGLRRSLYIIIFEADTKLGRIFDIALLIAILLSVLAVILETVPSIQGSLGLAFFYFEWLVTVLFTLEYGLRLYVARRPLRYAFSFFGLIDLLSILPAYISLMVPGIRYLMVVRVLRLLRVFRILKLVRYVAAIRVLQRALYASRFKIYIFLGVIGALVLIMGTLMYIVEGDQSGFNSIPQSMYWTIVTMTTVGYGDIVPLTTLGKVIASFMMLIGYAIIAVPTGIVTSELYDAQQEENTLLKKLTCPHCGVEISPEKDS